MHVEPFCAYNFGYRVCPALHVTEIVLSNALATISWARNTSKRLRRMTGKEMQVPRY